MKVLIWFLCILANALVTVLLSEAGILLGGIPIALLFGGTFWLARTLCKKWDERKPNTAEVQYPQVNCKIKKSTENKIIFCRKCGEKLIEGSTFCRKCGTKVILFCLISTENTQESNFAQALINR